MDELCATYYGWENELKETRTSPSLDRRTVPQGSGRLLTWKYKSAKWADRLQTPEEKAEVAAERAADAQRTMEEAQVAQAKRLAAVRSRGVGTIVGGN